MSEKKLIIDQMKLTYEGVFDLNGLYRTIDSWFYEKGYDRWELKNYEVDNPDGTKDVELELLPWKKTTDYFKNIIRLRVKCVALKDVEIEKEGAKVKLKHGKVMIIFDAYLESDYENRWEKKPLFYFLRSFFDKFVYKVHTERYEQGLVEECNDLHSQVKAFLNLYRY